MSLAHFIARQLAQPSGPIGRYFLPRLFNRRNRALNDLAFQLLDPQPDDRVLELGFGGGYLLERILSPGGRAAGVDHSPAMLAHARRLQPALRQNRLALHCAPADRLPFPDRSFSAAVSVNTLFYLPDPAGTLSELWRVLEPGSRLLLCFTRAEDLSNRAFSRQGLTLYRPEQVEALLDGAGFTGTRFVPGRDRHRRFLCTQSWKNPSPC